MDGKILRPGAKLRKKYWSGALPNKELIAIKACFAIHALISFQSIQFNISFYLYDAKFSSESFIDAKAAMLLMVNSGSKLYLSAGFILAAIVTSAFNAAAYGSSVEDLAGVFSIQKTIKIGSSSECFDGTNSTPDPLDPQTNDLARISPVSIAPPEDSQPPRLIAFIIEPKAAKSGVSIQSINLTARIIDDYSGLSSGDKANLSTAYFQSPSGKQTADAFLSPSNLTFGSILDGIYSSKIILPPNSEPGVWQLFNFTLVDGQGNIRVQSKDNLTELGFPVQFLVT